MAIENNCTARRQFGLQVGDAVLRSNPMAQSQGPLPQDRGRPRLRSGQLWIIRTAAPCRLSLVSGHAESAPPAPAAHNERRDAMAFAMAERGDREARDAVLRIIQRDRNKEKRARAESCWNGWTRPELTADWSMDRRDAGDRYPDRSIASLAEQTANVIQPAGLDVSS